MFPLFRRRVGLLTSNWLTPHPFARPPDSSLSTCSSSSNSPATLHFAPRTPPKTLSPVTSPESSPKEGHNNPPPVPPKAPRSPRARTLYGPRDARRPTFTEFLRELDPALRARAVPTFTSLPLSPPPTPPATTPCSSRPPSVFKSRRAGPRADRIPEEDECRAAREACRPDSSDENDENGEAHYWSPTLEAIEWSAGSDKEGAQAGVGVEAVVLLEQDEGENFPILAATTAAAAHGVWQAQVTAHRRGISIQGKRREVKSEVVRVIRSEVRSRDFL